MPELLLRLRRVLSVALVAGMLLAFQVSMARAERRVTGQVLFQDEAGNTVHAGFNVSGDNGSGSGRVAVDIHELGISWEGTVDCIDFPHTGAGWANFAGPVTSSEGVPEHLAYFHVEVVGQGQGNLPADYVRVRLLDGPYQGDMVTDLDPFTTQLLVGDAGDPEATSRCMYGPDLAWGVLTEHREVESGNLQVHGVVGGNRQHGMAADDDGDGALPAPDDGNGDGGNGDGGDGGDGSSGPAARASDRRATGGFVYDDGDGLVHLTYNVAGEDGQGSGRIRVRRADGSVTWTGEADCVDFVPEGGGWVYFTGHLTSADGVSSTHFSAEVIGQGQGGPNNPDYAGPDFVRVELLDGPERRPDGSCLLYWTDIETGWPRMPEFHEVLKGNTQVHGVTGNDRQHLDDEHANGDDAGVTSSDAAAPAGVPDAVEPETPDDGAGAERGRRGEAPPGHSEAPPSHAADPTTPAAGAADEPDGGEPPAQPVDVPDVAPVDVPPADPADEPAADEPATPGRSGDAPGRGNSAPPGRGNGGR